MVDLACFCSSCTFGGGYVLFLLRDQLVIVVWTSGKRQGVHKGTPLGGWPSPSPEGWGAKILLMQSLMSRLPVMDGRRWLCVTVSSGVSRSSLISIVLRMNKEKGKRMIEAFNHTRTVTAVLALVTQIVSTV